MTDQPTWLAWVQRLQAIAQAGLAYSKDPYDLDRFRQLRAMAVEIAAAQGRAPRKEVAEAFALGSGYPTPKVDIRAVVFQGHDLLFVRERAAGLWSLPGGWADIGESPGEVAARETLEESGYRVRPSRLLAVLDKSRHEHPPSLDYVYKVFVLCDLESGTAQTSHETDAVGFFGRGGLPPLETNRVTLTQIARLFEHHADPSLPTDFD
jgi:ADP-ribose pyrophosphatase YjhB (NUDIX family)